MLSADLKKRLLGYQSSEITEHHIYRRLARIQKSPENCKILERIAEDEKRHYISVAMDQPFKKRFAEMAILSIGVAGLSFVLGLGLRVVLGVEV